jgi:hypothetical protein
MTSEEYRKKKGKVHPLAVFLENAEEIIHEAHARKQTLSSGLVAEAVEETTRTQGVENDEAKPLP